MIHTSRHVNRGALLWAAIALVVVSAACGTPEVTGNNPTLEQVVLTPLSVGLQSGETQQFTVTGVWSDGSTTAPGVDYSATGGTITSGGLYTAGSTAGTFRVIATETGGSLADTSVVTITALPPTLTQVILTPATVTLPAGETQQFAVSGKMSDGSTTTPAVTYTATGGTISAVGLYTAGSTTGTFRVIARQQGGTLADTSVVTITAAVLTQVILNPSTVSLPAGLTQQFTVSGTWSDGSSAAPAVNYTATGGSITPGGLYAAFATTGTFRVIATQQGGTLADTSTVTITAAVLTQVILNPSTVSLPAGLTQQFTMSGVWSDGSSATPSVTYGATGGSITPGGLYTAASTTGTFRVIATQLGGTLADTSTVTITPPILTQVILTPALVGLPAGEQQQFTVSGKLSDGSTNTPAVTYTETGGNITPTGLYTAGTTTGSFQVIATQLGGTLADTAAVTITSAVLTQVILTPATASVPAGLKQQFTASGMWSDGSTTPPSVTYTATGGTVTPGGLYTAGSATGTFQVIATQQSGTLADTSTVTITPPVLAQVILTPATANVPAGLTQQFTVSGKLSDGSTTTPAVTYSASGGTITPGGLYTANSITGTFQVIATELGGTLADTSAVTITAPLLTQVILNPSTVSIPAGLTQQFSVSGVWTDGSSTTPSVTYSATGGTITSGGFYTAGTSTGTFRVIAVQHGGTLADTSTVTITAPILTQVILTPPTASVPAGLTQQFSVSGMLSDGTTTTPAVNYTATGGSISAGGLYTAPIGTGTYKVIATQLGGPLADTSTVTVTPAVLTQLVLSPPTASIPAGLTQQFSVSGTWSDGSNTTPSVTYNVTGGTITALGVYTAGITTGSFRVIATQQGGTLADTSAVTITAPVLTQIVLTPVTVTLAPSATQQFTVTGILSDLTTNAPAVNYSATGGTITAGGLYTAGSAAGSYQVIAVQQSGTLADTSAVTISGGRTYTTNFPLTENPISEGGNWIGGYTTGLVWSDASTSGGKIWGRQQLDVPTRYGDATAILTGPWGADQSAEGVVGISSMPADNWGAEIELRLRSAISPNVNTGYEITWKATTVPANAYLVIVRWNGALGSFDYLGRYGAAQSQDGTPYAAQNGDVLKATIVGNTIQVYRNGTLQATVDIGSIGGTVFSSGAPGVGFQFDPGSPGHNSDFGYTSFTATDAP